MVLNPIFLGGVWFIIHQYSVFHTFIWRGWVGGLSQMKLTSFEKNYHILRRSLNDGQVRLYFQLFVFVLCTLCCQFLWIVLCFIVPTPFSNVYLTLNEKFSVISWRKQVTFYEMITTFCTRQTRLAGFL
jgi:hypothetical protein